MNIELYDGDRGALLPLFALADDSPSAVEAYRPLGEILVARDGPDIVGHLQIVATSEADTLELKSMAVLEARQAQGLGRGLVAAAVAHCRERGARRLIVSTAAAGTGTLRFYQRQGFRMERIVRDAFGPHTGYPEGLMVDGIPLRDQVFLDMRL
jgi:GNAT superfamily N-acetyltransferase